MGTKQKKSISGWLSMCIAFLAAFLLAISIQGCSGPVAKVNKAGRKVDNVERKADNADRKIDEAKDKDRVWD